MTKRDFLTSDDVSTAELVALLDAADRHKAERRTRSALAGRSVTLIFEKPSTRTRVSFEVAVRELGGYPLPLAGADLQLGRGETIEDTAAVLSRYVHAIVLRTFAQETLERLARAGTVPVVNALSDYAHPCQALADLQTIRERKKQLEGLRLAYLGDGNNVCHSLLIACAKVGMHMAVATPAGYEPIPQVVRRAGEIAAETGASVELTHDPEAAAAAGRQADLALQPVELALRVGLLLAAPCAGALLAAIAIPRGGGRLALAAVGIGVPVGPLLVLRLDRMGEFGTVPLVLTVAVLVLWGVAGMLLAASWWRRPSHALERTSLPGAAADDGHDPPGGPAG